MASLVFLHRKHIAYKRSYCYSILQLGPWGFPPSYNQSFESLKMSSSSAREALGRWWWGLAFLIPSKGKFSILEGKKRKKKSLLYWLSSVGFFFITLQAAHADRPECISILDCPFTVTSPCTSWAVGWDMVLSPAWALYLAAWCQSPHHSATIRLLLVLFTIPRGFLFAPQPALGAGILQQYLSLLALGWVCDGHSSLRDHNIIDTSLVY